MDGISVLWGHAVDAVKWIIGGVVALLWWFWRQDRHEMKSKLSEHDARLNGLDSNTPKRDELTKAVDNLRHEVSEDIGSLREEVRRDIAALNASVSGRLDTMIVLLRDRN